MTVAKPKMTRVAAYDLPDPACPQCGASMWEATTTLGHLMIGWPHGGFVHTRHDGYAHSGDYLEMDCPECLKPSAVLFDQQGGVTLIAARTHTDELLLGTM